MWWLVGQCKQSWPDWRPGGARDRSVGGWNFWTLFSLFISPVLNFPPCDPVLDARCIILGLLGGHIVFLWLKGAEKQL